MAQTLARQARSSARRSRAMQARCLVSGKPIPSMEMTEQEFHDWSDEDTRVEWVDGRLELMTPSNVEDVEKEDFLSRVLGTYVSELDLGVLYSEMMTVRFTSQRRRRLPDLKFVAKDRLHIVKHTYIDGAPDLIVEIVSPESQSRDRRDKFAEYEKAGVREYWLVDPMSKTIEVYELVGRKFKLLPIAKGIAKSKVVKGFWLRDDALFKRPLPSVMKTLRELGVK